ncbi:Coiled-coil domain-containing protein 130 [Colletotrichum trifolii]|uniref:Coiled-coil domain-containing protein 130 n=1 Tax=Colletotrichum trifolii TaxID=5466 RepID=A0A4R8QVJ0_COLTR|nr:Coiled-coil domain-containing protein 130 [Colletotrichum trifolii]
MQGFNMGRYVPPDVEGTTTGNKLHKKHPLGSRASKPGAFTVRFEMPYAIWCSSCPKPTIIGQGVRFNAEKSRAGSYFSTPVWRFRMRHVDCGGAIEIETDPKNTAYVVTSGAKKRDTGEDKGPREGEMVIMTDAEREKLRSNAFASLEKTIEDREHLKQATERIDALEDVSKRQWDDPYARNQALRRTFRVGRKEREKEAAVGDALRTKMSLGIELVPATEEDARRAALVDFGPGDEDADKALVRPLFSTGANCQPPPLSSAKPVVKGTPKAELLAAKRKDNIVFEIVGNTRKSQDPFLMETRTERMKIPGLKRKREITEMPKAIDQGPSPPPSKALVSYDSESD